MSQIQTVKLAKLTLSDINVRKAGDDLLKQFAADISARGILQNLIVTPVRKPRGSFAVIAGSRRYRALMLLAERGDVAVADYDVPVLVLTADDATLSETSLAENFQRLAMTPADECRAFQHFLGENGDIDAVAKRFGLIRFLRSYIVYNADEIEGLPSYYYPRDVAPTPQLLSDRQDAIDAFFAAIPAEVRHGGGQAYFSPLLDYIRMPHAGSFRSADAYASTRGHETVHWSGHQSRLDRTFGKRFGDKA